MQVALGQDRPWTIPRLTVKHEVTSTSKKEKYKEKKCSLSHPDEVGVPFVRDQVLAHQRPESGSVLTS